MTTSPNRRAALRTIGLAGAAELAAPHIAGAQANGTTWKIQTSWPGGAGLQIFKDWCATHPGKDRRRAELQALRR